MVTSVSDSYVATVEAADAFFATKQSAATWSLSTTTSAIKAKALQEATAIIDSLPLAGYRFESKYIKNGAQYDLNQDGLTQTLEFPRVIDGVVCDYDYGTDLPIVPQDVKDACCWLALSLIDEDSDISEKSLQEAGIQSFSRGKLSVTFVQGAANRYLGLPQKAYNLLKKFLDQTPVVL
jgi:hypothetical protein